MARSGRRRAGGGLRAAARDGLAAQPVTLDLAGRGAGQVVDHVDRLGPCEPAQLGGAARAEDVQQALQRAGCLRAAHRDHVGDRDLAEEGIGAADDHRVTDRRIGDEGLLDLAGAEQFATPVDAVVAAPGEEQEPGTVEEAEVAGVQPARRVEPVTVWFSRMVNVADARAFRFDLNCGYLARLAQKFT